MVPPPIPNVDPEFAVLPKIDAEDGELAAGLLPKTDDDPAPAPKMLPPVCPPKTYRRYFNMIIFYMT